MRNLLITTLTLFALNFTTTVSAQNQNPASSGSYFITENYYKIKWGYADEFIALWKKNHYPLLQKTTESGDIISVKAEKPTLHSGEDTRWDFRVTIVWKNAESGVGKVDPSLQYRSELYPDTEKLDKDEQYRFSLLLAHWDVIVESIKL
ncbi:MAG: hypothetical protein ABIO60_08825 [Aquaticitalea sp.]